MPIDDKINGAEQASGGKPDYKALARDIIGEAKLSSMFVQAKSSTPSRYVPPHHPYHRRRHYSK